MKRYLLFLGDTYYPRGGWGDYQMDFDTLEEAKQYGEVNRPHADWCHVVDATTGKTTYLY
jgi:endonuclease IV